MACVLTRVGWLVEQTLATFVWSIVNVFDRVLCGYCTCVSVGVPPPLI